MMKVARQLIVLAVVACLVAPSVAQDGAKKKGKKNAEKKGRNAAAQVFAFPKGIEASDDQKASLAELKKEYGEKLEAATKKAGVTKEQRDAMTEARKSDEAKGKKANDLQEYLWKTAGLSEEQVAAMKEANELRTEIRKKVQALLTKEQRQELRQGKGDKKAKAAE